jgi:hypothetical protein
MFTWWLNRKDAENNNIFEGGFLGLDNIGASRRRKRAPLLPKTEGLPYPTTAARKH